MKDNITFKNILSHCLCLWESICNHCHLIKRSEDVIMEVAALNQYLIIPTILLTIIRRETAGGQHSKCRIQEGSSHLTGASQ